MSCIFCAIHIFVWEESVENLDLGMSAETREPKMKNRYDQNIPNNNSVALKIKALKKDSTEKNITKTVDLLPKFS